MYSRAELGRGLGLTRAAVAKWGKTLPEAYVLRVSMLTGVPVNELSPKMKRLTPVKRKNR